jgi:DNA-binding response OmpR family regulator
VPRRPKRVLIVDDDPAIQRLLARLLARAGHQMEVAGSGAEAASLLASLTFDLIVLDLFLPTEDGRRLLARWRRATRTRRVPIFILSAQLGTEVKTECFRLGADAYFEKPIDPDLIVAAVTSRLGRAGPAAAALTAPREPAPAPAPTPTSLPTPPPPPAPSPPAPAPEPSASGPRRVVLVEDDPAVAAIVRHRLAKAGYALHHATDGIEGSTLLDTVRPDLAILDLKLPGRDGLELLSQLRSRPETASIPVIMLTASSDEQDMVRAFALGVDDYLMKPFSPTELTIRVERLRPRS